ncbi:MAG: tetratricopeptide repeat protein [Bifidobacteriaceae bacterium]|nr:tetratricopeptide repeat protein [Bifidobacteriaceae bacterium]
MAIAAEAASRWGSCDSALTRAYILELHYGTNMDEVVRRYDQAITRCPDDPTALVEQARARLAVISGFGEGWRGQADAGNYREIEQAIADTTAHIPVTAAARAIAGDTYAMLARRTPTGPFTVEHFQQQAINEYQEATRLSSEPAIRLALAQAQLAAGDVDDAQATLESVPDTADARSMNRVAGAIAASNGDFPQALQRASQAGNAETRASPELVLDPNRSCETIPPSTFVTVTTDAALGMIGVMAGCGAGAEVEDLGFVPVERTDVNYNNPRVSPILEGSSLDTRITYAVLGEDWAAARDLCGQSEWGGPGLLCLVASADEQVTSMSAEAADSLQDFMRQWGQLDRATAWNEAWAEAVPTEPRAWERLGEVWFLQGDWGSAAVASGRAVEAYVGTGRSFGYLELDSMTGTGWARLRQASAERHQDQFDRALSILDEWPDAQAYFNGCVRGSCEGEGMQDSQLAAQYGELERGQIAYAEEDYEGAIEAMQASISLRDSFWKPVKTGAQEQAISLAYFKLGNYKEALDWANLALEADPFSPLYQEAVADAQRGLGGTAEDGDAGETDSGAGSGETDDGAGAGDGGNGDEAGEGEETASGGGDQQGGGDRGELIAAYRAAVDLDPTLFSSWNNLGVLLAQDGQARAAGDAFRRAIQAVPDYGYAWFNLGALEAGQPGLKAFLVSQGALGKAGALDPGWKGKDPVLTFDDEVYESGLDVSKPIPEGWRLAQTVRSNTPVITAGLVLMLLWRLGRDVGKTLFTERFAQGALGRARGRGRWAELTAARWPALVTAAISLAALLWVTGASGWREAAIVGACAAALLGWHALAPRLLKAGRGLAHRSFPLASLVTAVLAPFGLGFTPPAPLAGGDDSPVATRRAGVAALGAVTVLFAAVAAATAVPTARAAAVAGVLVVSSAMIPFHPLDGARIQARRWAEVAIMAALLAATAAVALSWL